MFLLNSSTSPLPPIKSFLHCTIDPGDLADQSGRRPVWLIAFILYFSANVGLALQNSYSALVVLRCVQSAGASSRSLQYFV